MKIELDTILECDLILEGLNARLAAGHANAINPQLPALNTAMAISALAVKINIAKNALQNQAPIQLPRTVDDGRDDGMRVDQADGPN